MQSSGGVERFLAHIVFVGLPGSGKSTLVARLLNLKGIDEMLKISGSTGVMDGIITVDVAEDESFLHAANVYGNCVWQKVDFGLSCLRQMGIGCFVGLRKSPEDLITTSSLKASEASALEEIPVSMENLQSQNGSIHVNVEDEKAADICSSPSIKSPVQVAVQSPGDVMATIHRLLKKEGFASVRPFLENKSSLYLSDTGE